MAIFVGTILAILALAVLPLLTPWFMHPALDAAGSAGRLDLARDVVHGLSDRSVHELVLGPATFEFAGPDGQPFYDPDERSHLQDARLLLGLFLLGGGASLLGLAAAFVRWPYRRAPMWLVIGRAGLAAAGAVALLGLVSIVAFETLFTLFHQVFFPGGNWAFDPATQRLVQLYPFGFWQIAATALGALVFGLGLAVWWLARRLGRSAAAQPTPAATSG